MLKINTKILKLFCQSYQDWFSTILFCYLCVRKYHIKKFANEDFWDRPKLCRTY